MVEEHGHPARRLTWLRRFQWAALSLFVLAVGCSGTTSPPSLILSTQSGEVLAEVEPNELCSPTQPGDDEFAECVGVGGLAADVVASPQEIVVIEFTEGWRPSTLSSVEVREASNGAWEIGPFVGQAEATIVAESDEQLARWHIAVKPGD